MASINQLVSEIAHSIQQPNNIATRRAIRLGIIHARNDIIRKSYNNHSITDKVLQQRVRLELIDVPDGDQYNTEDLPIGKIKRTKSKVPRPTRLANNLPFHSIRTAGVKNPVEIAFIKEASSNFYKHLPGMCATPTYDYINGYVYIDVINTINFTTLNSIIIESVFEYPQTITTETQEGVLTADDVDDDDEFLLPEDMIGAVKKVIFETFNGEVVRQTNETPNSNLVK